MKPLPHILAGLASLLVVALSAQPVGAVTYAYIPSYDNESVVRIDIDAGEFVSVAIDPSILTADACNPYGAAVMPNGGAVIVTCEGDDSVLDIADSDFASDTYAGIPLKVGDTPRGVAIEPEGVYAYVANYEDDTITKINIASRTVSGDPIEVGDGPMGVAAIRNTDDVAVVYVTNYLDGSVSIITDDGQTQKKTITNVGNHPVGIAATPDGKYVYVANQGLDNTAGSGSVRYISTQDNTIASGALVTGEGFWGVAVGGQGKWVYVSNTNAARGTVIDIATNSVLYDNLAVGGPTYGAAAPKNGTYAYAVKQSDGTITEVDFSADTPFVQTGFKSNSHPLETPYALGNFIGGAPPASPSQLTGSAPSYDRIDLTWSDNSDDETGFKIERRIKAGDGETEKSYRQVARVSADTTAYTDSGLLGETAYEYRIRAYNDAADSTYATTDTSSGAITTAEGGFSWCFIGCLLQR